MVKVLWLVQHDGILYEAGTTHEFPSPVEDRLVELGAAEKLPPAAQPVEIPPAPAHVAGEDTGRPKPRKGRK